MLIFVPSVLSGLWTRLSQNGSYREKYFVSWKTHPRDSGFIKHGVPSMHFLHFHTLARWFFFEFESYGPAILVTVGAALLMACGIGATCSPCKEKDEVFHRQVF
jgi:hypothetical protein